MTAKPRESSGKGLVCGIGIYEPSKLCMTDSEEVSRAYRMWNGMLYRASASYVSKRPSYAGVTVDGRFIRFYDFYDWVKVQEGWPAHDLQLDKDLLVKGNKVYSPDTCCLLPLRINSLLIRHESRRTDLPIGVRKGKQQGTFTARVSNMGSKINLGTFRDIGKAFSAYKEGKENLVRSVAKQYQDRISRQAFLAMMSYNVEIFD